MTIVTLDYVPLIAYFFFFFWPLETFIANEAIKLSRVKFVKNKKIDIGPGAIVTHVLFL